MNTPQRPSENTKPAHFFSKLTQNKSTKSETRYNTHTFAQVHSGRLLSYTIRTALKPLEEDTLEVPLEEKKQLGISSDFTHWKIGHSLGESVVLEESESNSLWSYTEEQMMLLEELIEQEDTVRKIVKAGQFCPVCRVYVNTEAVLQSANVPRKVLQAIETLANCCKVPEWLDACKVFRCIKCHYQFPA